MKEQTDIVPDLPLTERFPWPSSDELLEAMKGVVSESHPAAAILRAAWLLATVEDWCTPDAVVTSEGEAGT